MRLYVDADACPRAVKEILYRAVARTNVEMVMVSNLNLTVPDHPKIRHIDVPGGPDAADDKIAEMAEPGDLVITADIPLADRVVAQGAFALDPRGNFHTRDTIKMRLAVRNLMDQLRSSGIPTGGPAAFNSKDIQAFANQLDKFLAKARGGSR